MLRFLKNIRLLTSFPKRKRLELEKQRRAGYSVDMPPGSRGEWLIYSEGEKSLEAQLTWGDGCRLYTESLRTWNAPVKGERLNPEEYDLVLRRIREYLSIHTSEIILDDRPGMTYEEELAFMKEMGEREGWEMVDKGGEVKFVRKSCKDAGAA